MFNLSDKRIALNRAASGKKPADFLQREVADGLMERLSIIRIQPKHLLECGGRSAYLTQRLSEHYPNTEIIALDYAEHQLRKTQRYKIGAHFSSLPFLDNSIEIIVASMSLNEANDLGVCFRECKRILKPNGLLVVALLGVDTLKELRESFFSCADYLHRFPDMHDVGDLLLHSGFENPVMDMESITVRYQQVTTLFKDLKSHGAINVHPKKPKGLFGKDRWKKALFHYENLKKENAYPTTVEIIYGHAWVSENKDVKNSDEAIVRFA